MKKNRNCGGTMYPNFSQAMPIMGVPAPMMPPQAYAQPYSAPTASSYAQTYNQSYNNVEQQINNMQQQINSLENRVAKLESKSNTTTYNNKYSDSNYYML